MSEYKPIENMINTIMPNELSDMIMGYANPWVDRYNAVIGDINSIRGTAQDNLEETIYRHKRVPEAIIIDILNPTVEYILRRMNNPCHCSFCTE